MDKLRRAWQSRRDFGCLDYVLLAAGATLALSWVVVVDASSPSISELFRWLATALG